MDPTAPPVNADAPAEQWPGWVSIEMRKHHKALEALAQERDCRLIDLALGFAKAQTDIEAVVLGVCSAGELAELTKSWAIASPWQEGEWKTWALHETDSLDPRRWPH